MEGEILRDPHEDRPSHTSTLSQEGTVSRLRTFWVSWDVVREGDIEATKGCPYPTLPWKEKLVLLGNYRVFSRHSAPQTLSGYRYSVLTDTLSLL